MRHIGHVSDIKADAGQPHMVKNMIKFGIRQSFDGIEQIEDWRKKPRQGKIYEKAIKNWPEDETTKFCCHSSCS